MNDAGDDPNVISLSKHRAEHRAPLSSYTVTIERYAVNETPAITVSGMGSDVTQMDIRQLCRDMLHTALTFSTEAREAGGQATAVGFASIWTDGSVSALADIQLFEATARRQWIERTVNLVPTAFLDLLDDNLGPIPVPSTAEND